MDQHTRDVIRLAWTRGTGLADSAFDAPGDRHLAVAADGRRLEFIELFGGAALHGPQPLLEAAEAMDTAAFADGTVLSALTRVAGGAGIRIEAHEQLWYRDHYIPRPPADDAPTPLISHQPEDAAQVLAAVPADDTADLLPDGGPHDPGSAEAAVADGRPETALLTLIDDGCVAAASYRPVHALLADVRVVTAAAFRRRGHAAVVGNLAAEDALDSGLICQARVRPGAPADAALARGLGFACAGRRVVFGTPRAYDR